MYKFIPETTSDSQHRSEYLFARSIQSRGNTKYSGPAILVKLFGVAEPHSWARTGLAYVRLAVASGNGSVPPLAVFRAGRW